MLRVGGKLLNRKVKGRLAATINQDIIDQMRVCHKVECEEALEHDRVPPSWSHTVEMLLRKGLKSYKTRD